MDDAGSGVPGAGLRASPGSDPGGGTAPPSVVVSATGAAAVRRWVADTAASAGFDSDRVERFVIAVNEIVINAIQHGGGTAEISLSSDGDGVVGTVTDRGGGLVRRVPTALPPSDQVDGRGLWLAHELCDEVTIDSSPTGTRVRLTIRRQGAT